MNACQFFNGEQLGIASQVHKEAHAFVDQTFTMFALRSLCAPAVSLSHSASHCVVAAVRTAIGRDHGDGLNLCSQFSKPAKGVNSGGAL